jgi:hypothetical protein
MLRNLSPVLLDHRQQIETDVLTHSADRSEVGALGSLAELGQMKQMLNDTQTVAAQPNECPAFGAF